ARANHFFPDSLSGFLIEAQDHPFLFVVVLRGFDIAVVADSQRRFAREPDGSAHVDAIAPNDRARVPESRNLGSPRYARDFPRRRVRVPGGSRWIPVRDTQRARPAKLRPVLFSF